VRACWCLAALTLLDPAQASLAQAAPDANKPAAAAKAKSQTPRSPNPHNYGQRADVRAAAKTLAEETGLDAAWVRRMLAKARFMPSIAKAVAPAPKGVVKNWAAYRERFVEPQRIAAGRLFWQEHQESLRRAEQRYGVPASIIVGIIGVETLYGQHTGRYRVLDALATLAFDFPKSHPRAAERSAYFRQELGQFLRLSQARQQDPGSWLGSYAGAMGLPQFMPSSWRKYAVDFDEDGQIDLLGSADDAIGSVANYFAAYGWQTGQPTHVEVTLTAQGVDKATLLAPDIVPTFDRARFESLGALIGPDAAPHYTGQWALVEVFNGDDPPSYVAGTQNFYVVTRYNWSSYYALAVIELGQAIEASLQATPGS
jgi:membrane-bound lytic murein transglycosylase B